METLERTHYSVSNPKTDKRPWPPQMRVFRAEDALSEILERKLSFPDAIHSIILDQCRIVIKSSTLDDYQNDMAGKLLETPWYAVVSGGKIPKRCKYSIQKDRK
jgi:hypothetical protein